MNAKMLLEKTLNVGGTNQNAGAQVEQNQKEKDHYFTLPLLPGCYDVSCSAQPCPRCQDGLTPLKQ
jgi:hypothetical protein